MEAQGIEGRTRTRSFQRLTNEVTNQREAKNHSNAKEVGLALAVGVAIVEAIR
jgi:hypothetical protein